MKFIDSFLNGITMYRLVLYYLAGLLLIACVFGFLGILPYGPLRILSTVFILLAVCWITNYVFAKIYEVPANIESVYITALILALIITPIQTLINIPYLLFTFWAGILAMASKYILAINKKHIFNPAAIAVVLTAIFLGQAASWWVGTAAMLPFVLIGGALIVKKISRFDLVFGFLTMAVASVAIGSLISGAPVFTALSQTLLYSPLFFFAFVMLTEPLTTPPTKNLQLAYGGLVGFLFNPSLSFMGVYSTPELALVLGNIFSYVVSPKRRLMLKLKEKIKLSPDTYEFVFEPSEKIGFRPGQYLEWTLRHQKPDNRGNRRYFTVASSPTEKELRIGVKFYPESSSFKEALFSLQKGEVIAASQLAGDFTLPKDRAQKLAFIAGGIGVTPFRSMVKYMMDKGDKRSAVLLYSNRREQDIAYKDVFDEAEKKIGLKTIYALTEQLSDNSDWLGAMGLIDAETIKKEVPDYYDRIFYISGPRAMVVSFESTLKSIGIPANQIKTDFFPGFA